LTTVTAVGTTVSTASDDPDMTMSTLLSPPRATASAPASVASSPNCSSYSCREFTGP